MKLLITPTSVKPEALGALREYADELIFNPLKRPLAEDELNALLRDCDGYLAGLDFITRRALEGCDKLRAISRYGVGVDRVDLEYARSSGILVSNTPGANSEAVGELAFGMALALARRIPHLDRSTRAGSWERSTGTELFGKTIGIVGLGATGKIVARCARGFRMRTVAYDPFADKKYMEENGIKSLALDELAAQSDVISLHLPLNDSTRHVVNARLLSIMKPGALLVNTARGGIIDETAAYESLVSGHLGGLGLDAFETEPPKGSPLLALENVIVTPHTGAHTREASSAMLDMAVDNLLNMLKTGTCAHLT